MSETKPVLLASDVHLGSAPPHQEQAFMAWFEHAAERASRIIINGDLFDFWFEYRRGTTRGHERVLGMLRRTVDSGVPVTLMGGNHDWWGGTYLRDEVGVEFLQDAVVRNLAGRKALLAHGDGLGRGDVGYRLLRWVLRGRATRWAFGTLPPSLGDRIARRVSRTDRKWEVWGERHRTRSAALEEWAEAKLRTDPELELIVLGHTHQPILREVSDGQWYVNSGDWVVHRSFVTLEEGCAPRLSEWTGAEAP